MKFRRMMDSTQDSTTFIGEGTRFEGQLSGSGNFVICGHVEGDCEVDGSLTVAIDGHWNGTINAQDVIIAGEVNGDVNSESQVEVAASAKVTGKLSGKSIAVAEGAVIDGSINVTGQKEIMKFTEKRQSNAEESDQHSKTRDDATS